MEYLQIGKDIKEEKKMKLHELKEKIVKDINESNLPIDATYYVLKEIINTVTSLYNEELLQQNNKSDKTEEIQEKLEIKEEE